MTWIYSKIHKKPLLVMEERTLWGEKILSAIIPDERKHVHIPSSSAIPIGEREVKSKEYIIYISCAAKIAEALESHLMVSSLTGNLIPLPHQLTALSEALSGDRIRFLLADEVGLGKTIEAGMIFKELKIRGLVKRVLVVAPKGLILQWTWEMKKHFGETFRLIIPGRGETGNYRVYADDKEETERLNYWKSFDQAVCSIDSVKPLEKRRGWTEEEIEKYNLERFDNLLLAGWDLIIIDEAHRVAGSSDTVARHILGRGLSHCAPYILLLSATPHSGKSDSFRRLMSLLDEETFADEESITKENVSSFVIRTEKRNAIDFRGEKLFKPRHTSLQFISWKNHPFTKELYDEVTEYVRNGYDRAVRERNSAAGFLMVLLQRLVTSSTAAIKSTLEKRLDILSDTEVLSEDLKEVIDEEIDFDEFSRIFKVEREKETEEVKHLLSIAERCEQKGQDAKTEALLNLIYEISSEEGNSELKFLIFTEFVATQKMLEKYLTERGFSVAILNGSMGLEERAKVQRDFSGQTRLLISTDAGGEGINLQFCHVVINYDIPWAPSKLEQRIGRVDRIGQKNRVRAINFLLNDTVESRVYEILQIKLQKIAEEFGIDKTSDILDSGESEKEFRNLYINSIMDPGKLEKEVEKVTSDLLERARKAKERWDNLHGRKELKHEEAEKILGHPLPYWVEKMVVNYLKTCGTAEKGLFGYDLQWEDGEVMKNVVFSREDEEKTFSDHISLENPKVMKLVKKLPLFVQGQKVPVISIKDLPPGVKGYWSLWKIMLHTPYSGKERILPLFRQEDGRIFNTTAKRLWDIFLSSESEVELRGEIAGDEAEIIYIEMEEMAIKHGEETVNELRESYRNFLKKEREKGEYAFTARKKAIERIGLPEVKNHRLKQVEREKEVWQEEMKEKECAIPEISCLIICYVTSRLEAGCTE